jgi:hypothetical protein
VITGNLISDSATAPVAVAAILVWTSSAVVANNMIIGGSVTAIDTGSYTPVVIGNYNDAPTNMPNAIAQTANMRLGYGLAFNNYDATASGDMSHHILLHSSGVGINYRSSQLGLNTVSATVFYVSGTQVAYIDGTGINGAPIGQSSRAPGLFTTLGCTGLFQGIAGLVSNVPNTSTPLLQNEYLGANVGGITTNGTTSSYNATSDYRLKTTTGLADGSRIDSLTVHEGYFTALPDEPQALLLAHEVADVLPHIVLGEKDAVDEEGQPIWQSMDFAKIVPDLVAKCQALERRLAALEGVGSQ